MNTVKGEVNNYLIICTTEETKPFPRATYATFWKDKIGELHLISVGQKDLNHEEEMTEEELTNIFQNSIDSFVERAKNEPARQDITETSV